MLTKHTLPTVFGSVAASRPQATALISGDTRISYAALADRVGRLMGGLSRREVGPGTFVALHLPNHPAFAMAFLAVTALGGTVVPLNPLLKPEEIAYVLADSGARLVLTAPPLRPHLPSPLSAEVITIGEPEWDALFAAPPLSLADSPVTASDIAACLYTSGTTGRPKGALLSHRNLTADVDSIHRLVSSYFQTARFLAVLPLAHAYGLTASLLLPLLSGWETVLVDRFLPEKVADLARATQPTIFVAVPAMLAALLRANVPPDSFASLEYVVSGGAGMPLPLMQAFESRYGVTIVEGYGPTEASPVVSANPPARIKPGTVGPALPGIEIRVADESGRPLPPGEVGEVQVKGDNVFAGYLGRPEDTAASFVDGYYQTGDLGSLDADGYLTIVDRLKDLVIVGGLNVYPSEVEEVLLAHPRVAEAAVVGRSDPLRGQVPVAYVVLREGPPLEARELTAHCQKHLANFKCPRAVYFVESLPRNPTGKVLKRLLDGEPPASPV